MTPTLERPPARRTGWSVRNPALWLILLACNAQLHSTSAQSLNGAPSSWPDAIDQAQLDGNPELAESMALDALARVDAGTNPLLHADILLQIAGVYIAQSRSDDAESALREALAILEPREPGSLLGHVQHETARVYRYRAQYAEALGWLRLAQATFQSVNDADGLAGVYNTYGIVYRFLGQLEQSLTWHSRSLTLSRESNDQSGVADGLYAIASVHESLGEHAEALDHFEDVLKIDKAVGIPRDIAYSHIRVGMMQIELDDPAAARPNIIRAQELFRQISAPRDYQWSVATMARLDAREGRFDQARAQLANVLEQSLEANWPVLANRARHWMAELEHWAGQDSAGFAYIDAALADALAQESRQRALALYDLKVRMHDSAGQHSQALEALQRRNDLDKSLSNALRTSVLAAMQGEAEYKRQAVALELAQKERTLAQIELQREASRRIAGFGTMLGAFALAFLIYGRIAARQQNLRLQAEVADKTSKLRARNDELKEAYDAVDRASVTDPLTGLANRRFLKRQIEADTAQSLRLWMDRDGRPKSPPPSAADLVFFLIDLDHFKNVNDRYGHAIGDRVLVDVAQILEREFRREDIKVRWGGEEFLVLARFINRDEAPAIAERVRQAVGNHAFAGDDGQPLRCTCSIGFSAFPLTPDRRELLSWDEIVELADQALYSVKRRGRNGWAGYFAPASVQPERPIAQWAPRALRSGALAVIRS